jgi:tripartite-type tricarboxylate transporter receptor subunit TctC
MIPTRSALLALLAAPLVALAQAYPAKPIKLVVPYPPGASTDTLGRLVAQKVGESMGQTVIVENRAGASGNIGSEYVAKQPADGYTFLLGTDATHTTNYHLRKEFPFHPIKDFTPITLAASNIIVLVVQPSFPASNMKELIEYGKKNPGKLSYGSSGTGSPHHLSGVLLGQAAGIDIVHVPYKGGGPAVQDLLGGQIQMVFSSLISVAGHIKAGKLKALGVVQGSRYQGFPDIPAIGETVPGFEMGSWLAFFAPAGLPQPVLARLHGEIVKAINIPDVKAKLDASGLVVVGNTPGEFAAVVKADFEQRGRLLKAAGVQPE